MKFYIIPHDEDSYDSNAELCVSEYIKVEEREGKDLLSLVNRYVYYIKEGEVRKYCFEVHEPILIWSKTGEAVPLGRAKERIAAFIKKRIDGAQAQIDNLEKCLTIAWEME
jgi:hypothetical protein